MNPISNILVSLLPVFAFLAALIGIDSYKLIKLRSVLIAIAAGCFAAVVSYALNTLIEESFYLNFTIFVRYVAPPVEECTKVLFLIFLLRKGKIGFMVDAAIYGFAIGAGFSFIENVHYLETVTESNLLLWIIRGFGTAMMHGGTVALYGIMTKYLTDRYPGRGIAMYVPGILLGVAVHSLYNHLLISPVISTLAIMVLLPVLLLVIFRRSEQLTREWLGVGLDADMELLDLINSGNFTESRIGKYLSSLASRFQPEIIADMLCLLRLHTELSIRAKGILLMREAGFREEGDPEVAEKFDEINYLEKTNLRCLRFSTQKAGTCGNSTWSGNRRIH